MNRFLMIACCLFFLSVSFAQSDTASIQVDLKKEIGNMHPLWAKVIIYKPVNRWEWMLKT